MTRKSEKLAAVTTAIFLLFFQNISPGFAAQASEAPVPGEQVRQSDDLGRSSTVTVTTYDELVAAIRETRQASQTRIEQSKVREAWETGKLIDEHILCHKERAEYAKQVIPRLAKDLGASERELYYMLEFAQAYPILPTSAELTWSDYRELLSLNDPKQREEVSRKAVSEKWDTKQIRSEVKRINQKTRTGTEPMRRLSAQPGKPGTYRYVKATVGPEAGKGVIDLGFSNWYRTSKDLGYKHGSVIEVKQAYAESSSPSDAVRLSKRTAADLYTYRAWVVEVLDGDTVKAVIDLGFGVRSAQTLRLRGIDAPELLTAAGKEAKEMLQKMLQNSYAEVAEGYTEKGAMQPPVTSRNSLQPFVTPVLIKTEKSDKYDRYLADVFADGVYINQKLAEEGFAVLVEG